MTTDRVCKCANCGNETVDILPLEDVTMLMDRLTPGDPVPDGECKLCGALSYRLGTDFIEKTLVVSNAHLCADDCGKLMEALSGGGKTSWIWDYPEGMMVNVPSDRADDRVYRELEMTEQFWAVYHKAVALGCRKLQFDQDADVFPGCGVEED